MPQDTEYKNIKSENQAIAYRNRLNGWAIVRDDGNSHRVVVARFRTRSDGDGYLQHLRQLIPNTTFDLVFDCHT